MFCLQRAAERVARKLPETLVKNFVLAREERVTCCECSVLVSLFIENVTWLRTVARRDWVGRTEMPAVKELTKPMDHNPPRKFENVRTNALYHNIKLLQLKL